MSDDGKYLISYEIQENDENPVIILAEKEKNRDIFHKDYIPIVILSAHLRAQTY